MSDKTEAAAGAGGWVKVRYGPDQPLQVGLLKKWIDESYRGSVRCM